MNVRLLRRVIKAIQKEPRRFYMGAWVMRSSTAPCGTTACIGGHAVILDAQSKSKAVKRPGFGVVGQRLREKLTVWGGDCEIAVRARRILELDEDQFQRLCILDHWPDKFRHAYGGAEGGTGTSARIVKVAVKRIEHFIKTEGRE